jgi:hypothetical protein
MQFSVDDAAQVLNYAGNLDQIRQNLQVAKENLEQLSSKLQNAWQDDSQTRQNYLDNLGVCTRNIERLMTAVYRFSLKITEFANDSIATQNNV